MVSDFLLYMGLLYVLCVPIGHFLLRFCLRNENLNLPFFVVFPIILSVGLSTLSLMLFAASLFMVNKYILAAVVLALLSMDIAVSLYSEKKSGAAPLGFGTFSMRDLIPVGLFVAAFLNFGLIAGSVGWPPVGDAMEHGLQTSLLLINGKIRLDYQPLSSASLDNPLGFHALAAGLASSTGMLSGEAVFMLAASILVLIPTLLCSLTYLVSDSVALSSLAFLSAFVLAPPTMEYNLTGYFYNGPYPHLFGVLSVISFYSLDFLKERVQRVPSYGSRYDLVMLLMILGIAVIYPNFAIFPVLYILLKYSKALLGKTQLLVRKNWKILTVLSLACISIFLLNIGLLREVLSIVTSKWQSMLRHPSNVSLSFVLSVPGWIFISSALISAFFLFKRAARSQALFFIVVAAPSLASIFPALSPYLTIFLPRRILLIAALLSWPIIFTFIAYIFSVFSKKHNSIRSGRSLIAANLKSAKVAMVATLLVFLVVTPSLAHIFTFSTPSDGWFQLAEGNDDYKALTWINVNVSLSDLILNDFSYTSQFLLSFSVKNVTCHYHPDALNLQRMLDSVRFWKHPEDYDSFLELARKYGVKYVLVTSVSGYNDWLGGNDEYREKPFGAMTREVFDQNPFVQLVYESGLSAVYKVII